jgi:hypothetical protein
VSQMIMLVSRHVSNTETGLFKAKRVTLQYGGLSSEPGANLRIVIGTTNIGNALYLLI